jgi:hypothetical protein
MKIACNATDYSRLIFYSVVLLIMVSLGVVPTARSAAVKNTCSYSTSSSSYQKRIADLAKATIQTPPRILVQTQGSGNYGESGKAAFYTFDRLPSVLRHANNNKLSENDTSTHQSSVLQRVDLDLGPDRLAFYIDNVLTHDEADALAGCAEAILEQNGYSRIAPGISTPAGMRINQAAHWYPSHDEAKVFLGAIMDRIRHLVPQQLDGLPLYDRLSEKIAQFKYNQGDEFKPHTDGLFPGQGANESGDGIDHWDGIVSGMSMLFYLNDGPTDGLEGGETRLWSADGTKSHDVSPRKGRVLLFRRGSYNAVLHAGLPVKGEVPKYMALINLAYGERTGTSSYLPL